MQTDKPPYSLEIFDDDAVLHSSPFTLEPQRGIVARSRWLNVSAIENVSVTVTDSKGERLSIKLAGLLKAQASNDRFTMTVQGSQGFNRRNIALTVFVNAKRSEAA